MKTGIALSDGSYIDVRQISLLKADTRNYCTVVMDNGYQFECQEYQRIKNAIESYKSDIANEKQIYRARELTALLHRYNDLINSGYIEGMKNHPLHIETKAALEQN